MGARWWVLAVLAAGTVAATQLLPGLAVVGSGLSGLVDEDDPAVTAQIESFERFGLPSLSRTAVVQRDPEGLDVNVQADSVLRALEVDRRMLGFGGDR